MPTTQRFVQTNGLQLAYLDHHDSDSLETLILMPGLTANSHSFDGFITAGLSQSARVLALDLRGRGLSELRWRTVERAWSHEIDRMMTDPELLATAVGKIRSVGSAALSLPGH